MQCVSGFRPEVFNPSPGKFISNQLQHTCLQFSSSLQELDWPLQVCLISVVAIIFRIVSVLGKLLLKVMHYNIALLPKKDNDLHYFKLHFMESNALRYFCITFAELHTTGLWGRSYLGVGRRAASRAWQRALWKRRHGFTMRENLPWKNTHMGLPEGESGHKDT